MAGAASPTFNAAWAVIEQAKAVATKANNRRFMSGIVAARQIACEGLWRRFSLLFAPLIEPDQFGAELGVVFEQHLVDLVAQDGGGIEVLAQVR